MTPRRARFTVAAAVAVAAPLCAGFGDPADFAESVNVGGASGAYYTGAARVRGLDCTACHARAAGTRVAPMTLTSDPAELVAQGRYTPGATYTLAISLDDEARGQASFSNLNGFAAEWSPALGSFAAPVAGGAVLLDGGAVVAATPVDGKTAWSFTWTAPASDAGALLLHLGVVDGDGAGDPTAATSDPLGDEVATRSLLVCAAGATTCAGPPRRPAEKSAVHCAAAPGRAPATGLPLLLVAAGLVVGLVVGRLRARRPRRSVKTPIARPHH